MILGLRTDGLPVTGSTDHSTSGLENECLAQFGVAPGSKDHKGSGIKLAWFRTLKRCQHLTDQVSKEIYVKCHIMCLFGTTLFSDKSGISVHWKYLPLLRDFSQIHKFSWGSACLAHMYRSLCRASRYDCKDMDGPLALLLVWAWIRMPTIGPLPVDTSFPLARRLFDMFFQFVWDAYSPNRVAPHVIPFDINNGANFLSATVPLICFEAVEWHPTDRIRRQFGFHQDPPVEAMKLGASHNIVLTGPKNKNWGVEDAVWISQWLNSSMCVLTSEHVDNYQPSDQYMDWYIGKFGDHLRVSELAEQEEEGQQEQPYQQEQQPQQEQPPQQQGPHRQEQPLVSQSYAYAPYPYLPYQ
ncbi:hypothetical protein Ahy_B03g066887 isoform B [Arachis hypogaea]|uniref:Aminotransferase-like plant mobile domain-containing protein n=1 Tax=Arachis hypogaea TaxID=3818 RepID=A0A445A551_ARAHY|nr:hypothetical protein Ahy_B03g066887 isoform B [Arachis hypogaea]